MAENVGYAVQVGIGSSLGTYSEMSGVKSVSVKRDRTELDITNFKNSAATGHKLSLMGLKAGSISISGNVDLADTPQNALRSRYADGAATFIEVQWDGSTSADGEAKVTSYEESASPDGLVEFSCELTLSPNSGASAVWG